MTKETATGHSKALLTALQRGIPIVRRPWDELGRTIGMPGSEAMAFAANLLRSGAARRFGGVFDSRRLGYGSTLCAVDAPGGKIEEVVSLLRPHPGVTHCYEREGSPNLWFTMTAPAEELARELARIADGIKPLELMNLPALKRFKVEVVLDAAEGDVAPVRGVHLPGGRVEGALQTFSERDKALVRRVQGSLGVAEEPFAAVARELGRDQDEILRDLLSWRESGALRRIGFILRHRAAGFSANGMCVWPVPAAEVERAGAILAAAPEVTHCYERPSSSAVPYNLYAMIHARERTVAEATFARLSELAGLSGGRMLVSVREFKKSSPVFFMESGDSSGRAPV